MSISDAIRKICLGPVCLATLACGVEGFEVEGFGDIAAEAIPGQLIVALDERAQRAVHAVELHWQDGTEVAREAGDRPPFFVASPSDDPEEWIATHDFETRPAGRDALQVVVYLDGPGAPETAALRVPFAAGELAGLKELELVLRVISRDDPPPDAADAAAFRLYLTVDLYRPAHDEVTLHPVRVPRAGVRGESLVFALANGLDQPILPDYAGESLSQTAGSLASDLRGLTCGTGVVRFGRALAPGAQRPVGEPYYIGGAMPLGAGEHLFRFLYRATPNQTACGGAGCFLKREHFRATARFFVQ